MAKPKAPLADRSAVKVVATNRAAHHDYAIDERFEAGIALLGTEVKSIREGGANLREGYVQVRGGEAFLVNTHIAPYDPAGHTGHDPLRSRKLLLHKKEIARLDSHSAEDVPEKRAPQDRNRAGAWQAPVR